MLAERVAREKIRFMMRTRQSARRNIRGVRRKVVTFVINDLK